MSPQDDFLLSAALLVYAGSIVVMGFGAKMWADATAAVHRARAHGVEADMQHDTIAHARAAADEAFARGVPYGSPPPTDEELREGLIRQRAASNGQSSGEQPEREYTTSGDVTPDELNAHLQGGEFRL